MFKRKWLRNITVLTIVLLIAVTGCSKSTPTPPQDQTNQGTEAKQNTSNPPTTTKLEADKDLAAQIKADKGIENVMVQVVEGEQSAVNVDITINNEQELSADQVIEKYSKVIQEKYPNHTADIIVIKDGKQIKQATLK